MFRSCIFWSSAVFVLGLLAFICIGLPIVITVVVVKPRDPTFSINQASVTGFNLTSDGRLTSLFDIKIQAHNRNHKLKLNYRRIRVSIFKDKQNLGTDALPGFTQRKGAFTILRAQPVVLDKTLKKGPAFDFGFESGIGYLDFDVFMTAWLNGENLEVNCRHVVVNITAATVNSSVQNFHSPGCSVLVYNNDPP